MLFNTLSFAIFLPLVFLIYWIWANKDIRWRNIFIILASYIFYGWWDWRFLGLIAFSSAIDFWVGLQLGKTDVQKKRRWYLWMSIIVNLGLLGFFKYFNFFVDNAVVLFESIGFNAHHSTLQIILPVGISFYTFQTMSYTRSEGASCRERV